MKRPRPSHVEEMKAEAEMLRKHQENRRAAILAAARKVEGVVIDNEANRPSSPAP